LGDLEGAIIQESLQPCYQFAMKLPTGLPDGLKTPSMRRIVSASGLDTGHLLTGVLSDLLREAFGEQSLLFAMVITATVGFAAMLMFYLGARHLTADLRKARSAA